MNRKNFVLDTNILINNPKCIVDSFDEHNVILPLTVIEELDKLKSKDTVGYSARESLRTIENIRKGSTDIQTGVPRNDKGGLLRVVTIRTELETINEVKYDTTVPDNMIVLTALKVSKEGSGDTVFISNDCNARIKASFLKLKAERYKDDVVPEEYLTYEGFRTIKMPLSFFGDIKGNDFIPFEYKETLEMDEFESFGIWENEFVLLDINDEDKEKYELSKRQLKHIKQVYRRQGIYLQHCDLNKNNLYGGIKPKNLEQSALLDLLMDDDIKVITSKGPAGTGKTFLNLVVAMTKVIKEKKYDKIILLKPTITAHEDLGFLPGNMEEKLRPYLGSYIDNFTMLKKLETEYTKSTNNNDFDTLVKEEIVEIEHIGYLRGRSLSDCIIICDEFQNLPKSVSKTIISRVGINAKIILLGDIEQIDNRYLSPADNALSHVTKRLRGEPLYGHITLSKCERSQVSELASRLL